MSFVGGRGQGLNAGRARILLIQHPRAALIRQHTAPVVMRSNGHERTGDIVIKRIAHKYAQANLLQR